MKKKNEVAIMTVVFSTTFIIGIVVACFGSFYLIAGGVIFGASCYALSKIHDEL